MSDSFFNKPNFFVSFLLTLEILDHYLPKNLFLISNKTKMQTENMKILSESFWNKLFLYKLSDPKSVLKSLQHNH